MRRREALAGGMAVAGALGLAACGSGGDGEPEAGEDPELEALIGLLALERAAIATYEEGARFSGPEQARLLTRFAGQSVEHVQSLGELIVAAGGPRPAREVAGSASFIRDDDSAARAARAAGSRLIRGYVAAIPGIGSGQARRDLMTMLANDAEHVSLLSGRARSLPGEPAGAPNGGGDG